MGRDSSVWCSTLFSWRIMGLLRGCRSSDDSVFACTHGGLWVPATGCLCWLYGADGACIVELRVNDTVLCEGGFFCGGEVDICGLTENECKQEKKGVLSVLFESIGCGGALFLWSWCARGRPLSVRRWNYSSRFRTGRSFCLVQLLNVQCIT